MTIQEWGVKGDKIRSIGCSDFFKYFDLKEGVGTELLFACQTLIQLAYTSRNPGLEAFFWTYLTLVEHLSCMLVAAESYKQHYCVCLDIKAKSRMSHMSSIGMNDIIITMHIWLLTPGTVFDFIASRARSVILCSGTLSPIDSFYSELGPSFSKRLSHILQADHVIGKDQLKVCFLSSLSDKDDHNQEAKFVYANWSRPDFLTALGYTILQLITSIPNGVLVFVPKYSLLTDVCSR